MITNIYGVNWLYQSPWFLLQWELQ